MSDQPQFMDPRQFRDARDAREGRGGQRQPEDPAVRLVQMKFARAQLAAQIPSDEDFAALQAATQEVQAQQLLDNEAARVAAQERLTQMDTAITELEAAPAA